MIYPVYIKSTISVVLLAIEVLSDGGLKEICIYPNPTYMSISVKINKLAYT